ncbi:hypothetical protein NC652_024602 [Populus alba x Populus x berolinensis]|nr:hypothetical protein NC652_024602 [Populus alba x Populus x berolinensis]
MVVCLQSCKCCILLPSTSRHCNLVTAVTDSVAGKSDQPGLSRSRKWIFLYSLVRKGCRWYQTNNKKPLHVLFFQAPTAGCCQKCLYAQISSSFISITPSKLAPIIDDVKPCGLMYALELDSLDKFPEELHRPFVSYASSFDHCAKMVVA